MSEVCEGCFAACKTGVLTALCQKYAACCGVWGTQRLSEDKRLVGMVEGRRSPIGLVPSLWWHPQGSPSTELCLGFSLERSSRSPSEESPSTPWCVWGTADKGTRTREWIREVNYLSAQVHLPLSRELRWWMNQRKAPYRTSICSVFCSKSLVSHFADQVDICCSQREILVLMWCGRGKIG